MSNKNPIGIFDSGIGGLSVAHSIRKELPHENLIYLADSLHAPYGDKTADAIKQRSALMVDFLLQQNVKAVVVACNTATVSAIQSLRSKFSVPIIGIEPGVKPAMLATHNGVIGVLATEQTLMSQSFIQLASRFSADISIEVQACPGLVEQIERSNLNSAETNELVKKYLRPLLQKGADTIVLGCTHYAFLSPLIKKIAGKGVEIINTHDAVAKEVLRRVEEEGISTSNPGKGRESFWTSGDTTIASQRFSKFWGQSVTVSQIK